MKKSILIKEEIHLLLKEFSVKSGLKLKFITEEAIIKYIENNKRKTNEDV